MSVVAVVPMKGHSERVPGKNLRSFGGRPLFFWVTTALIQAKLVDEVMIDTDSDQIEETVLSVFPDTRVHRRPEHLHGDTIPMHDVVSHFASSITHEHVLQTHSTNPLLTPGTIDRAIEVYLSSSVHDSLMSVTPRMTRFFLVDGSPVNHNPEVLVRTQDLEPLLEENSNIYIAPRGVILDTGRRVGSNPMLFPIEATEAVDIDDETDFRVAEFLLKERCG